MLSYTCTTLDINCSIVMDDKEKLWGSVIEPLKFLLMLTSAKPKLKTTRIRIPDIQSQDFSKFKFWKDIIMWIFCTIFQRYLNIGQEFRGFGRHNVWNVHILVQYSDSGIVIGLVSVIILLSHLSQYSLSHSNNLFNPTLNNISHLHAVIINNYFFGVFTILWNNKSF